MMASISRKSSSRRSPTARCPCTTPRAVPSTESADTKDSFGRSLYKNLMNGVSHMLPFVVGGGIMIALAFLLDDYSIDPLTLA